MADEKLPLPVTHFDYQERSVWEAAGRPLSWLCPRYGEGEDGKFVRCVPKRLTNRDEENGHADVWECDIHGKFLSTYPPVTIRQ